MAAVEWTMPGMRMTEGERGAEELDVETETAVPVFMCWRSKGSAPAGTQVLHRIASRSAYGGAGVAGGGLKWLDSVTQASLELYFVNGGGPCYLLEIDKPTAVAPASVVGWNSGWRSQNPAFRQFVQEPAITLAAMPQLAGWVSDQFVGSANSVPDNTRVKSMAACMVTAWQNWLAACTERRDVFYVLDVPPDPAVATACIERLRDSPLPDDLGQHAALYGPHVRIVRREKPVPPSGAVLGLMVRLDATHGIWRAPANEPLNQVVTAAYRKGAAMHRETGLDQWLHAERASINPIRSFPARGTRVWGCRTLAPGPDSPFRYVQVRRTVTWLEANLRQICRFAVFEPNHELTWCQLRGLCTAWLRRVWQAGALAGGDEDAAFSVRVGLNESMTQENIDRGELIVRVGVAVLRPAEFVDIELLLSLKESQVGATARLQAVAS
ncbi:TPA: phage tail sheath family protein [Burkholderia orbicola]|nr:phage tail sheath family protein [Burkholderia cenocepacia]